MELDSKIEYAAQYFWSTRARQSTKQKALGVVDAGARSAVTGGKQLVGFEQLTIDIALRSGIEEKSIHQATSLELPGFYRPTKKWDLLVIDEGMLVAAIEFKSQVGPSFGNNFNNRLEEAVGTATDLWTAYREGAFTDSPKPWLGYFFVLEDCEKSRTPVKISEPHFSVFPEFKNASYSDRYTLLLQKLVRERLYDASSLILTQREPFSVAGSKKEISAKRFFVQFQGHLKAYLEEKK